MNRKALMSVSNRRIILSPPSSFLSTLLRDLNLFVLHINSFYKRIHKEYVEAHHKGDEEDMYPKNWIKLMNVSRHEEKVRERILKIFKSHNLNESDFENLVYLRKTRNSLCHPRLQVKSCSLLADQNWSTHRCYKSLKRLFSALTSLEEDVDKNRPRNLLPNNWRSCCDASCEDGDDSDGDCSDDGKANNKLQNIVVTTENKSKSVRPQVNTQLLYSQLVKARSKNKENEKKDSDDDDDGTK